MLLTRLRITVAQGVQLPLLPSNVRIVRHSNSCYDWGTFGWVLSSGLVDTAHYKNFIFLNSSVRGPFLPPYAKVRRAQQASVVLCCMCCVAPLCGRCAVVLSTHLALTKDSIDRGDSLVFSGVQN